MRIEWFLRLARRHVLLGALLLLGASATAQAQQISESALQQIEALQREKLTRTPAQQKLDSQLLYALKASRKQAIAEGVPTQETDVVLDSKGGVLVDIKATVSIPLLKFIDRLGGTIVNSYPTYQSIRAVVPLAKVEDLARRKDVIFIQEAAQAETNSGIRSPKVLKPEVKGEPSPLFRLRGQSLAQRKANLREQLPSLLAQLDKKEGNPGATTDIGVATSAGDTAHKADVARNVFNAAGQGIAIGVLSDSYNALGAAPADVANGDLPGPGNPNGNLQPVQVLSDVAGSDEGRAMLQIIHDLAPKARLLYATAFNGDVDFANQIVALRAAGADIIVDDVSYFNENPFQDGVIAQGVNTVVADGALYLSSAGNSGNLNDNTSGTWEGDFKAATTTLPGVPGTSTLHSFSPLNTTTTTNVVAAGGSSRRVDFFWSDPQGASSNDHDVYVLNAAGTAVVRSSTNIQNGTQNPIEQITTLNVNERIAIARKAGAQDRFLHLETGRGRLSIATAGRTRGHNAGANTLGIAAVDAATAGGGAFVGGATNPVETFSSDGPRRIFYTPTGTPLTPGNFSSTGGQLLQKPDLTGADGVATTLPPSSGLNPFFGTSAGAPHVAAVAGLLKSYNPSLTAVQLTSLLKSTALDIEAVGVDRDSGSGIVLASNAIQAAPLPPAPTLGSFNPTSGVIGTVVTITGTNFFGVSAVRFGGVNASVFTVNSPTQITATVPAGALTGLVSVVAAGGTGASVGNFTILPSPVPTLTAVTPASGTVGTSVVLTGTGFTGTSAVTFNGVAAVFTVNSNTQITTTVPVGATSGPLVVTTPGGTVSLNFVVPPTTVLRFNQPTSLPILDVATVESPLVVSGLTSPISKVVVNFFANHTFDGDLTFTLVGPDNTLTNLVVQRGGSGDNFGTALTPDTSRTNFDDSAANPITSGTPPFVGTFRPEQPLSAFIGKTGSAANGTWRLRINDGFAADVGTLNGWSLLVTVAAPGPAITTIAPTAGVVNTTVTLTGSTFTGATAVTVNGVAASFTVNSDTQITLTVPAGATTGPIQVTGPGGVATSGNFTVLQEPLINSISPITGPVGTTVTINGSNFTGATAVRFFKNKVASFVIVNDGRIDAVVPAGAQTGTIRVVTPGGAVSSKRKFVVTTP